jgi:hypothetical protein
MQAAGYGARGCLGRGSIGLLQEQLSSVAEQEKNKLEIGYSRFETASFPGSDSTIERRKMRRFPDTDDDRE